MLEQPVHYEVTVRLLWEDPNKTLGHAHMDWHPEPMPWGAIDDAIEAYSEMYPTFVIAAVSIRAVVKDDEDDHNHGNYN